MNKNFFGAFFSFCSVIIILQYNEKKNGREKLKHFSFPLSKAIYRFFSLITYSIEKIFYEKEQTKYNNDNNNNKKSQNKFFLFIIMTCAHYVLIFFFSLNLLCIIFFNFFQTIFTSVSGEEFLFFFYFILFLVMATQQWKSKSVFLFIRLNRYSDQNLKHLSTAIFVLNVFFFLFILLFLPITFSHAIWLEWFSLFSFPFSSASLMMLFFLFFSHFRLIRRKTSNANNTNVSFNSRLCQ